MYVLWPFWKWLPLSDFLCVSHHWMLCVWLPNNMSSSFIVENYTGVYIPQPILDSEIQWQDSVLWANITMLLYFGGLWVPVSLFIMWEKKESWDCQCHVSELSVYMPLSKGPSCPVHEWGKMKVMRWHFEKLDVKILASVLLACSYHLSCFSPSWCLHSEESQLQACEALQKGSSGKKLMSSANS